MEEDRRVLANYSTIINNECDPGAKRQMWSLDPEQTYFEQERESNGIPEQNTGNVQKWLPHTILITLKDEYQIKEVLKKDSKHTGGKKKKRLYLLWKSGEGSECQELQISKAAPVTEQDPAMPLFSDGAQ